MSRLFSQIYSVMCQNIFLNVQLTLMLICFVFTSQVNSAPSYYPMGLSGSENPVMRQYKLLSLMGSPSPLPYSGPQSRKATRSASGARNCFFSPVQCHLTKTSMDSGRQRRRTYNGNGASSFESFSPVARFRRAGPTWQYNGYYY